MSNSIEDIDPRLLSSPIPTRATYYFAASAAGLLALLLAFSPHQSEPADPQAVAENCAGRDLQATAAISQRFADPTRIGKEVFARSANMWIAEARRLCANGRHERAERYYRRIIEWTR